MSGEGRRQNTVPSTRDQILDAADEFLKTHPFRDMTVSELMSRTSVSRPAFYLYFRDRYEIVIGLVDRISQAVSDSGLYALAEDADSPDVCASSMRHLAVALAPSGYVVKAIVDACAADQRLERLWRERFLDGLDAFGAHIVGREQAAGRTPQHLDPVLTAKLLSSAAIASVRDFFGTPDPSPELVAGVGEVWARMWSATLYAELPEQA